MTMTARTRATTAPRRSSSRDAGPFLEGERVVLRPLQPSDLDGAYIDWLNDYDVTRFLETGSMPTTRAMLEQYVRSVSQNPDNVLLAIVDRASGRHIGNIKLGPIHALHRRADVGILIGEASFRGRGCGREAMALILDYGFRRLNLHKITLGVHADHRQAVQLYRSLGFRLEGTLKEQLFRDGKFRDKAVMGILRREYLASRKDGHGRRR